MDADPLRAEKLERWLSNSRQQQIVLMQRILDLERLLAPAREAAVCGFLPFAIAAELRVALAALDEKAPRPR